MPGPLTLTCGEETSVISIALQFAVTGPWGRNELGAGCNVACF